MNDDRLEKLLGLMTAVNESITKKEFVVSFRAVYDFVKKIKEVNDTELATMKLQLKRLSESVQSDTESEVEEMKSVVNSMMKDCMSEMRVEYDAKMQSIDRHMMTIVSGIDGMDGKDADEEVIVGKVLKLIPIVELDTPISLVEKLETLTGDDRLDASAIKNLPEATGGRNMAGGRYVQYMADVKLTDIQDGEVLMWDADNRQFINGASSSGGVDTANSPNADEFARFTDADTIEGRTVAEVLSDLGFVASITELNYTDGVTSSIQTQLDAKIPTSYLDTDTSLTANSDVKIATQKAVKAYVDNAVVGLLDYRGSYDASSNLFPATGGSGIIGAIIKGDFWIVSVAGTLGGTAVTAGDLVIALVDTPGQTAGNWNLVEHDLGYAPENSANKVTSISGASTDVQYPSAKLLYDQLALKQDLDTQLTSLAGLSYGGNSLKVVRVNAGETAFELATISGGSGISRSIVTTSGSATMGSTAATDYVYFVAGNHTMSLPAASGNTNRYTVKNLHSAAITIDTTGAENVEGAASMTLQPNDAVELLSDDTNWYVA